jgi:SAM-dependent methyltransferase
MEQLDEPLALSAPLARRMAAQLCRKDPATGADCSWLHGFWQYLRLMGLAATPERHAAFYRSAFDGVICDQEPPRLLVSGAADYSMLAHVLAAFRARGIEPAVTVIDACETPLWLNRWYAERASCRVDTVRCDVLDYAPAETFDAVCTHSFLGQFSRQQRPALLAAWRRLLRPGGVVITAHPLRPFGPDDRNRFTPEQAQAFRAAVASGAEALRKSLGVEPQALLAQAEAYMRTRYGYPVRSREEVLDLFEGAGFAVDYLACGPAASGGPYEAGGPGLRNKGVQYASVVARRK